MKTTVMIMAVASILSFASCKKDYVCKCTTVGVTTDRGTVNDTKKNAKARCAELESTGYVVTTCEAIKQ